MEALNVLSWAGVIIAAVTMSATLAAMVWTDRRRDNIFHRGRTIAQRLLAASEHDFWGSDTESIPSESKRRQRERDFQTNV